MQLKCALLPSMGTGGGVSAFAAVHGETSVPGSPPTPSTDSSEEFLGPTENAVLACSDDAATLLRTPKSVVELGSDSVSVRLGKGENVVVVGLYSLWVKQGEVSLVGAALRASSTLHHVFVPVTHAIPSITAISDLAELVISSDDNRIRYLGDISRPLGGIWEPTFIGTTLSFHVLGYHSKTIQDVSKELRRLALEHWLPPIHQILRRERTMRPRVLVSGAGGTGKSTLCRVLINKLLTMNVHGPTGVTKAFPNGVIFLDIDLGQPELAAPGIIYLAHMRAPLLGPSFANLIIPHATENAMLRMHYIGAHTPRESPSHYQNCVSNLLSLYRNYETVPLIINTCGWNTGSGKTILLSAVRGTILTDIVHIGDTRNAPLQELMQPEVGGEPKALTLIPSPTNKTPLRSGEELREMQLQSYLHASKGFSSRLLWDRLAVTMMHNPPTTHLDILNEVLMIVMLDQGVKPGYLIDALDGSVVAIVIIKHDSPLHRLSARAENMQNNAHGRMHIAHTPNSQLPYLVYGDHAANPLDAEATECLGLALVTAALPETRQLRIRSPVSAARVRAEVAKGYGVAFVLARQQGLQPTMESNLAREEGSGRLQSGSRETIAARQRASAERLAASLAAEPEPEWKGFFEELASLKTRKP